MTEMTENATRQEKVREGANRQTTVQQFLEELVAKRTGYRITSMEDVERRLELSPHPKEIELMFGRNFEMIRYGMIENSGGSTTMGYTMSIPEGKMNPKIRNIYLPDKLWIFDENGAWLNPMRPCYIPVAACKTRELFGWEEIPYDIMAIPVHEDCICGGGLRWLYSNCTITRLSCNWTNALICYARIPAHEEEKIAKICRSCDGVKGSYSFVDGHEVVITWLLDWKQPTGIPTSRGYKADLRQRNKQKHALFPTSHERRYDAIEEAWRAEAQERERQTAWAEYLAQRDESRQLFVRYDIYQKMEQAGYNFSMAGDLATISRVLVKKRPGRKPIKQITFQRELPISPDGLIMVDNFLRLHQVVEELEEDVLLNAGDENTICSALMSGLYRK